jgi:hypothetical protein
MVVRGHRNSRRALFSRFGLSQCTLGRQCRSARGRKLRRLTRLLQPGWEVRGSARYRSGFSVQVQIRRAA